MTWSSHWQISNSLRKGIESPDYGAQKADVTLVYMNRDRKSRINSSPNCCLLVRFHWNYVSCNNKNNSQCQARIHDLTNLHTSLMLCNGGREPVVGAGVCFLEPTRGIDIHFLSCQEYWPFIVRCFLGITLREWNYLSQGYMPYPGTAHLQ